YRRKPKKGEERTFNSPWGIRFPWTDNAVYGPYSREEMLSIPLGELDFLGPIFVHFTRITFSSFNSPWGIRFPWTMYISSQLHRPFEVLSIPLGELDFLGHSGKSFFLPNCCTFNSPWGIRFPWTWEPV